MGCMPSKNAQTRIAAPRAKVTPQASNTQLTSAKAQILDSIKRADPILFEKTMHTYELSPTEIIGQSEQMRTILHYIAEVNFAEGMELAMEYILQHLTEHVSEALNVKDAEGNTAVMLCCVYDSVETLEVLMKSEHVNVSIKNNADQDAYAIAYQNSSPCLNILSSSPQTQTRETTRSHLAISQVSQVSIVPKLKTPGLENLNSLSNGPRQSVRLKSVQSARNESKITPDTRLYKVLSQLDSTNDNFIDEEFPHDNESIIAEELQSQYLKEYGTVKWLRPHQFLNCDIEAISLFEGIDLNHVSETPLAGCELYSAFAAMVEFPQRLVKVFTGRESNKHGAYSVKFLVSGINIEILLDDYLPCSKDSKPLFSRPNTTELWFSLLEKAFAKLYGNYNELGNIQVADALQMMTGMPSSQHSLKEVDVDELWNQLLEYDKRNYIFCAGNNKAANDKKNRVFSVVRLCEAGNYHIVKLKNHFGDFSWKGDFSDGSQLWTQELKDEVGHYDGEKNYFYMDIKEFVKQFDFVSVCYYNDNLIKSSEEVTCNHKKPVFFEIEVDRQMEVFISVHQKHPRFVDEPGYEISPVEILVAELHEDDDALRKIASGEKESFAGKQTVFADDKGKIKLSEGKYIIRVKIRWVDEEKHEFTLNAFSPYTLSLKKVKARKYQDFLERVYLDAGSRSAERYQLGNRCEFGSSWCGSHLWLYGTNKGNKTWNLEIVFNKVENLRLCKKYKTSESVLKMVIPPGGQAVAFAKRINSKTVELNWNFNQSWS